MQIGVLTIGTEILIGHTVNTNLTFVGDTLATAGYTVSREVCIEDNPETIRAAVQAELQLVDILITIGGLGPTRDDMTRQIIAKTLDRDLRVDEALADTIRAYLKKRHVKVNENQARNQAALPEGADALDNENGTAPGIWCPWDDDKLVIMLPGPPRELRPIFKERVMPRLITRFAPAAERRLLKVCGIPESTVAQRVEDILDAKYPRIEIAYCARPGAVDIRLTEKITDRQNIDNAVNDLKVAFGDAVLDEDAEDSAESVAELLKRRKLGLATAESCTGGGIAKRFTDRPGASEYLRGGFVCYVNSWKMEILGVSAATLEACGAVSAETATEMLDGLLRRPDVDAGIAVTGIAGPGGGTPEKPVGLVFIATGIRDRREVERYIFPGDRNNVRMRTVAAAINQLRQQLID
ncbi:MAG: competence/damage-inducible protein A [Lentisphaeria bacterium]